MKFTIFPLWFSFKSNWKNISHESFGWFLREVLTDDGSYPIHIHVPIFYCRTRNRRRWMDSRLGWPAASAASCSPISTSTPSIWRTLRKHCISADFFCYKQWSVVTVFILSQVARWGSRFIFVKFLPLKNAVYAYLLFGDGALKREKELRKDFWSKNMLKLVV